jgi:hypothetical protein
VSAILAYMDVASFHGSEESNCIEIEKEVEIEKGR